MKITVCDVCETKKDVRELRLRVGVSRDPSLGELSDDYEIHDLCYRHELQATDTVVMEILQQLSEGGDDWLNQSYQDLQMRYNRMLHEKIKQLSKRKGGV